MTEFSSVEEGKVASLLSLVQEQQEYLFNVGDSFYLRPYNWKGFEVRCVYTEYYFRSIFGEHFRRDINQLIFPSLNKESECSLLLKRFKVNQEIAVFYLTSLDGKPFYYNGTFVTECLVRKRDHFCFGLNECIFRGEPSAYSDEFEQQILKGGYCREFLKSSLPILIMGETGTGKTTLAKDIHENYLKDEQKNGQFIHLNLASFNPQLVESELFGHFKGAFTGAIHNRIGAFAQSHGGTLFLDEIDSISPELQTKLLTFLDSGRFRPIGAESEQRSDFKLIVASGQGLENKINQGLVRNDFAYRISSGAIIRLSPLRQNSSRLKSIIFDLAKKYRKVVDRELMDFYLSYAWPGNYRELSGHIQKKCLLTTLPVLKYDSYDEHLGMLQKSALKEKAFVAQCFLNQMGRTVNMSELKIIYAKNLYRKSGNNLKETAQKLDISLNTLRHLLADKNETYEEKMLEIMTS